MTEVRKILGKGGLRRLRREKWPQAMLDVPPYEVTEFE
jgi:hypothetical protein